jgi:[acyl-carrier-protein] S-malonyltransferase
MKKAFLFPGQGSQFVGMARNLYEQHTIAREMFSRASEAMGLDLAEICLNGPEELLKQTKITQPAIFVHSLIVFNLLKEAGWSADAAAGHSLGEYSALVASGALSFEQGLNLVKIRGAAMQECGEKHKGAMAAVIGMSMEEIQAVCREAGADVQPANYNSPGQIVISGEADAVKQAMDIALRKGARKAIALVVSGAFHSPLMLDAQHTLAQALDGVALRKAQIPVYCNVTALPATEPHEIKQLLIEQVVKPVRWQETIEHMYQDGYTFFVELGPGKVLQGLAKRINREINCDSIGDVASIRLLMERKGG